MTRSKATVKVTSLWKPLERSRPSVPHGANFIIFLHCCKQEEHFYTYVKNMFTSPKYYVLTLPCENETLHFQTFIMHSYNITTASSVVWTSSSSTEKTNWQSPDNVQNVRHWHEHEHASMLAIGQLRLCVITQRVRLIQTSPHMHQTLS